MREWTGRGEVDASEAGPRRVAGRGDGIRNCATTGSAEARGPPRRGTHISTAYNVHGIKGAIGGCVATTPRPTPPASPYPSSALAFLLAREAWAPSLGPKPRGSTPARRSQRGQKSQQGGSEPGGGGACTPGGGHGGGR